MNAKIQAEIKTNRAYNTYHFWQLPYIEDPWVIYERHKEIEVFNLIRFNDYIKEKETI